MLHYCGCLQNYWIHHCFNLKRKRLYDFLT